MKRILFLWFLLICAIPVQAAQDEKKAKWLLSAQEWIVYTNNGQSDALSFSEGKFGSKNFSQDGFEPVSFTAATVKEGDVVWDALQKKPNGDLACWKGQLKGNLMQGMFSVQRAGAAVPEDFSFTTIAPPVAAVEKIAPAAKKKAGWFR